MIRIGSLVIFNAKKAGFKKCIIIKSIKITNDLNSHVSFRHLVFSPGEMFWIDEEHLREAAHIISF